MKPPLILRAIIAFGLLAYFVCALIIGITVSIVWITRPFQDYHCRFVGLLGLLGIIIAISTTAVIVILACMPIYYVNKRTKVFKDNFPE
jgi:hypothetical protein